MEVYLNSLVKDIVAAKRVGGLANYYDTFDIASSTGDIYANAAQVVVFPQPADRQINITASEPMSRIEIFNLNGSLVMAESAEGFTHSSGISHLPQGVFFVKIGFDNGATQVLKIVKR